MQKLTSPNLFPLHILAESLQAPDVCFSHMLGLLSCPAKEDSTSGSWELGPHPQIVTEHGAFALKTHLYRLFGEIAANIDEGSCVSTLSVETEHLS